MSNEAIVLIGFVIRLDCQIIARVIQMQNIQLINRIFARENILLTPLLISSMFLLFQRAESAKKIDSSKWWLLLVNVL